MTTKKRYEVSYAKSYLVSFSWLYFFPDSHFLQ